MYGVVVTPPLNEAELMHAVFVEEGKPLLFIRRLPLPDRRKLGKEERKQLDKDEKAKSLLFGDWIEFEVEDIDHGCIDQYKKIYPLNEARSTGEHLQIASICVFPEAVRDWENDCYCELFGRVRVDPELKKCFLPNVAFQCWISVEVTRISSLNVEVGEYIDLADEQNIVIQAPWNRGNTQFATAVTIDSDDSDTDTEGSHPSRRKLAFELFDIQGVLVDERTIYSVHYPDVKISLAYVRRERRPQAGCRVQFNAFYSVPLRSYLVRSYRHLDKEPFKVKPYEFGSQCLMEVQAKWRPELPMGYLSSKDRELGLIHDSDGLLLPALLGKNPYAPVCVYVADTGPSRLSRFGIKELSDMAFKKANAVMNSGYADLLDDGMVLGNGSVLSCRYICLKIRFDENSPEGWEKLTPGTWITFTAWSASGVPDFRIKTWSFTSNPLLVPVHAVPIDSGYAFEARGCFEAELSAIKSVVFGYIEIPSDKRSFMKPKDKGVTIVWVREDKGEKPKSRFTLYATKTPDLTEIKENMQRQTITTPLASGDCNQHAVTTTTIERAPLPCKGSGCEGRHLLQKCMNKRAFVDSLIRAEADDLLAEIIDLLTMDKPV